LYIAIELITVLTDVKMMMGADNARTEPDGMEESLWFQLEDKEPLAGATQVSAQPYM
jgi:hypothetical protein